MKQILVSTETIEKTARLAEIVGEQDAQLAKLAAEKTAFDTKQVPELVDAMIKQGVLHASQRTKAAAELIAGGYDKLAQTTLFLIDKIGAPSMGAPAESATSKVAAAVSEELDSNERFRRAILDS